MFQANDDNYDFDQSYNLDLCQYHGMLDDALESMDFIQKNRTTNDSESSQEPLDNSFQQIVASISQKSKQRRVHKIDVKMSQIVKFCDSKKGEKLDTLNLSKNVKTETSNFLKLLIITKQTTSQQTQAILKYNSKNGSLDSYEQLFYYGKIRDKCLQFYSSKYFIKNVLESSKMQFQNKILLIKFLEKIRSNTWKQLKTWKNRNGIDNQ